MIQQFRQKTWRQSLVKNKKAANGGLYVFESQLPLLDLNQRPSD
jgi:hypothetical protein